MKATEVNLLSFLRRSPQFIIPIYQRTYSWTEPQCLQLWEDILRTGSREEISAHFIGAVVYIEKSLYQVSSQSSLLVIDGQQRLTTVSLIIEALARRLGDTEPIDGFSAKKLRNYYLLNMLEDGKQRYKLLLTQTDELTMLALVEQKPTPDEHSLRLIENFCFFEEKIDQLDNNLASLCKGLEKLMVVDISLIRGQDNPQLIFESMNSTGLALSQADLIRNFVLMGFESDHQEKLYNEHWRPMELAFGQKAYSEHFDSFMRHYLTMESGVIPRVEKVYEIFKFYAQNKEKAGGDVDGLLANLHKFARHYCALAFGSNVQSGLAVALCDLRDLGVDVAYPLLLELYEDYSIGKLSANDLIGAIRLVESYVFRRAVCAIPTNSLNRTFAGFSRSLKKERYLESICAHFQQLPSYRRFPSDEEFQRELKARDLYNFRNRSYLLRRLENHGRKEPIVSNNYTIEHILPQNKDLSEVWRDTLGDNWREIQNTLLHAFGNLTLTGYNSEYSDRSFPEKRDMEGGFRQSPLRLNEGLGEVDSWNEEAIRDRADRLAHKAVSVWKWLSFSPEELSIYQAETEEKAKAYSIEDQIHLGSGSAMLSLFEVFRREVLMLDPCVSEEFLKHYIAYRAETNFVDVVPQVKQLRLSLNMQFHELQDPQGLAQDMTNVWQVGNGDVRVDLDSQEKLLYVMGLVRQAFEKQMGNVEVDS